jgi:hypothetical protein
METGTSGPAGSVSELLGDVGEYSGTGVKAGEALSYWSIFWK